MINKKHIPVDKQDCEKDKPFLSFSKEDHQNYEKLISVGSSESTISFHLRTYYRRWNLAIKEGYCSRKEHHPSNFIKFQAYKNIRTKKRSINQDYLGEIFRLKFLPDSRIIRSQMLLQFMYYGRGINFGDMCKLKREDIANGTIRYIRSKNNRPYDYTLHPKAVEVVELFKHCSLQNDAGYIFSIIFSKHGTPRKIDNRIHDMLGKFNEDLNTMAKSVDIKIINRFWIIKKKIYICQQVKKSAQNIIASVIVVVVINTITGGTLCI